MNRPTVMTVFGTRPEAIKVAPLIKCLEADERLRSVTVSTGQHREMLDQVNGMFNISPDVDLGIMRPDQGLNMIVARTLQGLDEILASREPRAVVVQGDTSTAMAAALAAFNREVPVVHLEAGLRTGNLKEPFPEEGNRKMIGQIAQLHLAPTVESRDNLIVEGVDPSTAVVTGNTVIDALLTAKRWDVSFSDNRLEEARDTGKRVVMVTTHRRENIEAMENIGQALRQLAERYPAITFVFPAHLNPKVRAAIIPQIEHCENVLVTDPLPYDQFTRLMAMSTFVLTDSGGVQEEAPSLGKPVLVMRNNTERPEAVHAGTVRLVGTRKEDIVHHSSKLLDDPVEYEKMANSVNPYGDGKAADRSVAAIAELLGIGSRLDDFRPFS
ncbi:non-hydrolyzing UDP-N-acetylglucosamine 2-epimerase [Corynebacterium meridianum]|uniref:UDP-N-acetylglucosamine 2-epimerase (non-hydrolyzing) n=1 Tax=Corynebacterium meridianum TaxID=2765363 RepID=A0A934IA60_9CORY|nr:UDP-N-acetylglucosamine 2-epimerase (non-hydrolyzing) [Corynebacterium meridianum]MBI8990138.1 UDP-N-acetylglucosamine 2-epimerase (non-hydrolyzing) [Corynebacterium meridianum]